MRNDADDDVARFPRFSPPSPCLRFTPAYLYGVGDKRAAAFVRGKSFKVCPAALSARLAEPPSVVATPPSPPPLPLPHHSALLMAANCYVRFSRGGNTQVCVCASCGNVLMGFLARKYCTMATVAALAATKTKNRLPIVLRGCWWRENTAAAAPLLFVDASEMEIARGSKI